MKHDKFWSPCPYFTLWVAVYNRIVKYFKVTYMPSWQPAEKSQMLCTIPSLCKNLCTCNDNLRCTFRLYRFQIIQQDYEAKKNVRQQQMPYASKTFLHATLAHVHRVSQTLSKAGTETVSLNFTQGLGVYVYLFCCPLLDSSSAIIIIVSFHQTLYPAFNPQTSILWPVI